VSDNRTLVLAVDTSSAIVSAALAAVGDGDVQVLASRDLAAANRHGELLAAAVAELFAETGSLPAAVGAVAAGLGPGPFTGLRVGIVTATSLADALGVPAYGVCSLDAVAHRDGTGAPLLVCTDARRKQVYWALYDATGARVEGPDIATAQSVAERFAGHASAVVGAGAALYADAFGGFDRVDGTVPVSATDVVRLAASRVLAGAPSDVMEPMYLRRPDATPPGRPKSVLPA
jgi:tRNA threonylcarbamoyl adenosine modification protein YeaZ